MSPTLAALLVLFAVNHCTAEGRWSRQLSSESSGDWVPLDTHPTDNDREARVLTQSIPFQSNFFPTDSSPNEYKPQETPRQLYLQSIPAGQSGFPQQPNQPMVQLTLTDPRYPFAQAFVPRSIQFQQQPQQQQQNFPQFQQQLTAGQIIQHPTQINNQFYNQMKIPQFLQSHQKPLKAEVRFVDGYKVENASTDYFQNAKKKPTNLLVKNKEYVKPEPVTLPRATERSSASLMAGPTTPSMTTVEKEEVQLLYVPLESLQRDQKQYFKTSQQQEALRDSIGSPVQINNQLYTPTTPNYVQRQQTQLHNIQQELIQQAFNTQNLQNQFKQTQFDRPTKYQPSSSNIFPSFSQTLFPKPDITTPKSKKLKAHQPPLAIYMINKSQDSLTLSDVLSTLKDAKGISVLDSVGANSPSVFVGPNNLRTPSYYSKFELPYLSSIDGNRIQRNIDRLPFFVAPLSYKAPQGFAKIPFPAPHVGSVIINPFMNEAQDSRPAPLAEVAPSSFAYSTFQQNPTTESFRSTVTGSSPLRQSTINYFPSATPNPSLSHSTIPGQFSSFLPFDSFNSHRPPPPPSKKPEPVILTSSRQPLSSYFSTTPSKPTVSYFSFSGPEYSTIPTRPSTTTRPPTTQNYFYRGHYITNAADPSQNPLKIVTPPKDVSSERPQTTPVPPSGPTLPSENPYLINHIIQQTQEQEEVKNFKANEIQEYNTEKQNETPTINTFSSYVPERRPAPIETVRYSPIDNYSPIPYFGPTSSVRPNEIDISSIAEEPSPHEINEEVNKQSVSAAQYQYTSGEDDNSNVQYLTEAPTTQEIITTTTTTTQAPTTKSIITRRPIHLRGRTRTTTPKPETTEPPVKPTTRRTPLRERRPSTYKSRFEKTTTEASATESSNFESAKKAEAPKLNRYSYRNRGSSSTDEETKTTTESALPKTSAAARNQRLRSRGKTHFKTADNYEGSDYVPKKGKGKENEADIAYQRDVLHQNYPVTIVERMSTLEVHTTPLPSTQGVDLTNGKIRIYETTGNTQRSYLLHDNKPSEAPETYDNQPVFQGEEQKYLTQPDTYVEVSSERIGGGSSIMPELFINSRDSSTVKNQPSTSENYERFETTAREQIKHSDAIESEPESVTQYHEETTDRHESSTFETPVARFRNKLRSRPKHIAVTVSKDGTDEENAHNRISIESKKVEEHTENHLQSTRRSSLPNVSPITYRPSYNRHHTTMRIEEIEAELKSNRQQLKSSLHPTTSRHPVYIPEASPSTTSNSDSEKDEPTTKRNFARRRPVRPTTAPSSSSYRQRTTTEPTVESTTLKRVRVRGRIRTRPTTTEKAVELKNDEDIQKNVEVEEKPSRVTERTSVKYSTRGRLATQKYFKRPVSATEKNPAISQEVTDDQASYDSINRPEYVEYKANDKTIDDYNPENGKAETQWSPKLSHSSFRPIFNPNLIADEIKQDGVEYGSKLSSNSGDDEIITVRNPYEDVLISVTPSSNTIDLDKSSVYENIYPTTTFRMPDVNEEIEDDKKPGAASTFESVLEEVMRNLEQQDENEYTNDYGSAVMKHEGGEIGAIPPENYQTTRRNLDFDQMDVSTESRKVDVSPFDTSAYSSAVEHKYTTSTTERQPRRRGVWRKVKRIRPVKKNTFETAESQYYGNSNNDLLKIQGTLKETIISKNNELKKDVIKIKEEPEKVVVTTENVKDETTIAPTVAPEVELVTEVVQNLADMDLGTGSPDMLMMNMFGMKAMSHEEASLEDQQEVLKHEKNDTVSSVTKIEDEELFINNEAVSEKLVQDLEEDNEKDVDVKDALAILTTTEIPMENPTEYATEAEEMTTKQVEVEEPEHLESELEKEVVNENVELSHKDVVTKIESVENTTPGLAYWDPMNVISTSKSTEISHETEICYRGRCIKTKKEDHNNLS